MRKSVSSHAFYQRYWQWHCGKGTASWV